MPIQKKTKTISVPTLAEKKKPFEDAVILTPQECVARYKAARDAGRISTGLSILDSTIGGGLPIGQVITIVGFTGVRKSELVRQIRRQIGNKNVGIIHIDVELGSEQIVEREICQRTKLPPSRLKDDEAAIEVEKAFVDFISESSYIYHVQPYGTLHRKELQALLLEILEKVRAERPELVKWLVIIDSIQRMAPGFTVSGDPRLGVQNFMYWADQFTRQANVAMLVTSERARPPKRTDLSKQKQLRDEALMAGAESRAIEYVSHALLVLFPIYGDDDEIAGSTSDESEDAVRCMIAKNRSGMTGWLSTHFMFVRPCWGFYLCDRAHRIRVQVKRGAESIPEPDLGPRVPIKPHLVDESEATVVELTEIMADGKRHSIRELKDRIQMGHGKLKAILLEMAAAGHVVVEQTTTGIPLGWRLLSEEQKAKEQEKQKKEFLDGQN